MVAVLEEQVEEHPEDISVRTWLAQAHLDARNVEEALKHLDILGDLQLQAGSTQDAAATIKTILMLNPPNADAYRQLLQQILER
jgi:thioredoxin-like negative regulator of GroEL